MFDSLVRKVAVIALVVPVFGLLVASSPLSIGQDKAKKTEKTEKTKGRLPPYFSDVVSGEQREKIYAIQAKYEDQIKDLNAQLAAIAKKQNDEIDAVLTAEQKEKIDAARAEAVAKKKKKSDDKKKTEAKTN